MPITLSQDTTKKLQASIKRYAAEHLDEEMGDLKAGLFLDYCLREIGPAVYNQAIADAQKYFQGRVEDLEGVSATSPSSRNNWPPAGRGKS